LLCAKKNQRLAHLLNAIDISDSRRLLFIENIGSIRKEAELFFSGWRHSVNELNPWKKLKTEKRGQIKTQGRRNVEES